MPQYDIDVLTIQQLTPVSIAGPLLRRIGRAGEGPEPTPTESETTMRFMIIVKANKDSEAGAMPQEPMLAATGPGSAPCTMRWPSSRHRPSWS